MRLRHQKQPIKHGWVVFFRIGAAKTHLSWRTLQQNWNIVANRTPPKIISVVGLEQKDPSPHHSQSWSFQGDLGPVTTSQPKLPQQAVARTKEGERAMQSTLRSLKNVQHKCNMICSKFQFWFQFFFPQGVGTTPEQRPIVAVLFCTAPCTMTTVNK